jgi:hypothetical protein
MGMWNWLFGGDMAPAPIDINPSTGLPMVGDIGGVDVGGNPYGMDMSAHTAEDFSVPMSGVDSSVDFGGY